jgi:hypothetical protein
LLQIVEGLPEALIVGFAYGSFGPAVNKAHVDFVGLNADVPDARAGVSRFHAFLRTELLSIIEPRYRADPRRRILFGQSLGGSQRNRRYRAGLLTLFPKAPGTR